MIKPKVDISVIAYDEKMQTVSVKNRPDCLVGFSTFECAANLADKYNLEIVSLKMRAGGKWEEVSPVGEPYDVKEFYYDHNFSVVSADDYESEEDYIEREDVIGCLRDYDFESFDDILQHIENEKKHYERIQSLESDEFLWWYDDFNHAQKDKRYDISMQYDSITYQIALMPPFDYE